MPKLIGVHTMGGQVGMIVPIGYGDSIPAGALPCNGAEVPRASYPALFAKIGTSWGIGDGSTTFNLPDLRGVTLRGAADGSTIDPNRTTRSALVSGTWIGLSAVQLIGSSTISVNESIFANLAVGMSVSGSGIPANSIVLSKNYLTGSSFTLGDTSGNEVAVTSSNFNNTLTFSKSAIAIFTGSYQDDAFQGHLHNMNIRVSSTDASGGSVVSGSTSTTTENWRSFYGISADSIATLGSNGTPRTATETRSKNAYTDYVIIYA